MVYIITPSNILGQNNIYMMRGKTQVANIKQLSALLLLWISCIRSRSCGITFHILYIYTDICSL